MTIELINIPEYWQSRSVRPRGFTELCDMVSAPAGKIIGLCEWKIFDPRTGEVRKREWLTNVITDHGAVNLLASAIASASNANPWNNLLVTNNSGSTTLTSALTSGVSSGTTLAVASLPAAVPLDYPAPISSTPTVVQVGYGTGQTQNFTINGANSQGATSLTVLAQSANANYAIGSNVVPIPNVGENPSNANLTANATSPLAQYSGNLPSGAFTYSATTGAGNRSVTVVFTFATAANGGSTTAGSYTDVWLVNASSNAGNSTVGNFVGNYINHLINTPMPINNSNSAQVSIQIKL